jgi:galactokinase
MSRENENEAVPVARSLDGLYPSGALSLQQKRWARLSEEFSKLYGRPAAFVARCPGRVNIIGEHIDYSLYDVLPMGVAADVVVAVAIAPVPRGQSATISLANMNREAYRPHAFALDANNNVSIDPSSHEWTNYFKAGYRGALSLLKERDPALVPATMDVLVDGSVPAGGGLSSSAAFVSASALATLYAHSQSDISKYELTELAIVSERSVGVNSGGMDQAASVFSVRGDALQVSFHPILHTRAIPFPETDPPITFMIAQSFVVADKHVTAPVHYNLRVVECTLAAGYLAASLGLTLEEDSSPLGQSLRGFQNAYFASKHVPLPGRSLDTETSRLEHMLDLVEKHLPDANGYTREQISERLETPVPELEERYMTTFPIRASKFLLRQRAQHVFSEAIRVHRFISLLRRPLPSPKEADPLLRKLGDLMNETQASCRDVYECSCPELDELCNIARRAGSYGSRLTGAGWGGCSVHLVPRDKVDAIRDALIEGYYKKRFPNFGKADAEEAVVVSEPGHGAMV